MIIVGLSHHGVFYAMANAFFLAFSFRYREIVKSGGKSSCMLTICLGYFYLWYVTIGCCRIGWSSSLGNCSIYPFVSRSSQVSVFISSRTNVPFLSEWMTSSLMFIHDRSLIPLRYSIVSVGRCFAAVSRSLQLVYCSHVLPLAMTEFNRPFDPCNPFDAYFLQKWVYYC